MCRKKTVLLWLKNTMNTSRLRPSWGCWRSWSVKEILAQRWCKGGEWFCQYTKKREHQADKCVKWMHREPGWEGWGAPWELKGHYQRQVREKGWLSITLSTCCCPFFLQAWCPKWFASVGDVMLSSVTALKGSFCFDLLTDPVIFRI